MIRDAAGASESVLFAVDLETYWDPVCNVENLGISQYIRHPDFFIHGGAVSIGEEKVRWLSADALTKVVDRLAQAQSRGVRISLLAHNANFDGLVLAHRMGFVADRYIDTAAMAVAAGLMQGSLAHVAQALGIGTKSTDALTKTKGIKTLDPDRKRALAEYCIHDLYLTKAAYLSLMPLVSEEEMEVISWTTWAAAIEPFVADLDTAEAVLHATRKAEDELVERSGVGRHELSSSAKLVDILAARGVEVDTKIGKAGPIPQLAKTDPWVRQAMATASPEIRTLLEARLALRSTLVRTRGAILLDLARTGSPFGAVLKAYGSHTGRWSGGDKLNFPNLPGPGSPAGGGELSRIIRPRPFDDTDPAGPVFLAGETA